MKEEEEEEDVKNIVKQEDIHKNGVKEEDSKESIVKQEDVKEGIVKQEEVVKEEDVKENIVKQEGNKESVKKNKVKPDLLDLCHILPKEVVNLEGGGKGYNVDPDANEEEYAAFRVRWSYYAWLFSETEEGRFSFPCIFKIASLH